MINEEMRSLGDQPNAIRMLFAYGMERRAQIGADKVFDFSIGNPSVPAPQAVQEALETLSEWEWLDVHGYTASIGDARVREAVARNLNERFDAGATPDQVYMTAGAAPAIACSLRAVTHPGDEVIVISPYFTEYDVWIANAGCKIVVVPAHEPDFQPDIEAICAAITEKTAAIILNSPNNPTGTIYWEITLEKLAHAIYRRSMEIGHEIYLISDEPYRELVYDNLKVTWMPSVYAHTLVCYSWSKSFSLPGDRIGYVYVNNAMPRAKEVFNAVAGAGRAMGYVCAPAMLQHAIARSIDEPVELATYTINRMKLMDGLAKIGYTFVEPEGAFYLWVRSLEPDAVAFSEHAKKHELLLVPGDCFGTPGWVRVGYCVSRDTVLASMPAFEALYRDYHPEG